MTLKNASIPALVRELLSRLPDNIGGHDVTTATLALHPAQGEHDWTVHLRLEDGRRACGQTFADVQTFGELATDAKWALFASSPREDGVPFLDSYGDEAKAKLFPVSEE